MFKKIKKIIKENSSILIIGAILTIATIGMKGVYLTTDFGINMNVISMHIESNNTDNTIAKIGDTVTITFTAVEELFIDPVITLENQILDVQYLGRNKKHQFEYQVSKVMKVSDPLGPIQFSVEYMDYFENKMIVDKSTDNSSVIFYN